MPRKYGKKAQEEVKKEMRRYKRGTATSGKGKTKVKSRQQAIAIALSKARKKGAKVPKKKQ
jgi:DNA-directed RNA polymerase beta' subunit